MELVRTLAPIASRACHLEEIEPQDLGRFFNVLLRSAGLDDGLIQLLFEHILQDLVQTETLESCEFHEGLNGILSSGALTELLIGAFSIDDPTKMVDCVGKLYGGEVYKPDKSDWKLIQKNMSAADFKNMAVGVIEMTCDKLNQMASLLMDIYDIEEEFEIAETMRIVFDRSWILDILPQQRKAARRALQTYFTKPFPFTSKVVGDFCRGTLSLSPLPVIHEEDSKPSLSSSSDSDIESRGSLDDFVVDDEEDEGSYSSDESENSSSSAESIPIRSVKTNKRNHISSSSSSDDDTPRWIPYSKKRR